MPEVKNGQCFLQVLNRRDKLTEEMKAELDRRIEKTDRNPDAGIPREVAKARVLGRLPR